MKKKKFKPFFSVITVVKNDQLNIQKTIKSVISQNFKNFEYIVLDGKSADKTFSKINEYKRKIQHISSRKDKGIYFAMNKGIKLAKGTLLVFVNSGDLLTKNALRTINHLYKKNNKVDFIFGSSSTWNVCPSGYYMTGLHTTGTISIDRMKCCPETTRTTTSTEVDATSFTYKWGRCSYVDWSNSFSARGWSECPDKMQLAGLHTSCTNSISCINQAKCCSYTHTNYETETTYETTIPMKKGVYTLKTSGTCFMFLFIVNYNSSSHYCYFYSNIFIYTHFLQVQRQDNLSK